MDQTVRHGIPPMRDMPCLADTLAVEKMRAAKQPSRKEEKP
jgi:hypothetical protein